MLGVFSRGVVDSLPNPEVSSDQKKYLTLMGRKIFTLLLVRDVLKPDKLSMKSSIRYFSGVQGVQLRQENHRSKKCVADSEATLPHRPGTHIEADISGIQSLGFPFTFSCSGAAWPRWRCLAVGPYGFGWRGRCSRPAYP